MSGFEEWIGRERIVEEVLHPFPARGLAALLDRDPEALGPASVLPAGWHWAYFRSAVRRSGLGEDGHPRRGSFLPPVSLPHRMWAGGSLSFTGELRLGDRAVRRSTVRGVEGKEGRSGPLVFVTVRQTVETERGIAVEEEQLLVYRGAGTGRPREGPARPARPSWSEPFVADPVTLFRFSALTFNGHRIHYDHPYATGVEGYPGLVVHGPLLALLLLDGAARHEGEPPGRFRYRGLGPAFAGESLRVEGTRRIREGDGSGALTWVIGPRGTAMRGEAFWPGRWDGNPRTREG